MNLAYSYVSLYGYIIFPVHDTSEYAPVAIIVCSV